MPRGIYTRTQEQIDFVKRVGYANRGKKHTEETRKKVSQAGMGRPPWNKGLKGAWKPTQENIENMRKGQKGKVISEEQKIKISIARKGKKLSPEHKAKVIKTLTPGWNRGMNFPNFSAEKHYGWKGGKETFWKKFILKRDNYTCQECKFREDAIMAVDHIKPKSVYPELRYNPENMRVLCPNCHIRKTNKEKSIRYCNMRKALLLPTPEQPQMVDPRMIMR